MAQSLDLALVKVFHGLLNHRSVSRAAMELHLSQSAVSKQLAKLREVFQDPLFVRNAHGLSPSPRALMLAPQFQELNQLLKQIIQPPSFQAADCQRRFVIDLLETAYPLALSQVMPHIIQYAPDVVINMRNWQHNSMEKLLNCDIDLGITCREFDPHSPLAMRHLPDGLKYAELARETSVALIRKDHPLLAGNQWGLQGFLQYGHINLLLTGIDHWLLDDVLAAKGEKRKISASIPDVYNAMSLCQQTDLILCMPARYANNMQSHFELELMPIPVDMKPGSYVLVWHQHYDQDPAHKWLRELIIHQEN